MKAALRKIKRALGFETPLVFFQELTIEERKAISAAADAAWSN